jgi:ATP-binding cassette subfamily B protein
MYIIRKLLGQLGQYKLAAILAPIFTLAAVGLEVLIPYVMALLIDRGISVGDMGQVFQWGAIMLLCALLALLVGASSGVFGSEAATGLAANLRDALFEKVQTYSFGNIDKFSTAGLVTRMTTDVTNVQNAFQMVLIIATRAPITLVASIVMCPHQPKPLGGVLRGHGGAGFRAHLHHAEDHAHVWQRLQAL